MSVIYLSNIMVNREILIKLKKTNKMATIKTFSIARIKNLGNYENIRVELQFEMIEGENYLENLKIGKELLDESIKYMITGESKSK